MKKTNLVILSGVAVLGMLASCGGGGGNSGKSGEQELWICVYDGGYGNKWIEDVSKKFTEATGIPVHCDVDTSILDRIESALKNGGDYDIYMSHGINWQSYAASGWLANLDDLYTSKVEGFEGTFADRLSDEARSISKITGKGDTEEHYYKVCYTQGAGGLIYNMDMFEENGWEVPKTYDELKTLCQTILDAEVEVEGSRETVVPFAWSGKDRQYYWDYPVFEWWYQLAGKEKVETVTKYLGPTGKYADGYEMYNPDSYYKEFIQAYDMWWDLIANNSNNSIKSSYAATLGSAQSAFVNGKAAMIPYAQWGKYELSQIADDETLAFDIAMMPTPKATATAPDCNYMVGYGDSMIVPAKSSQIENAKKFLNFMATAEACRTFVEDSNGAFLAFDYSNVDLSELEAKDTFTKSVHEKLSSECFGLSSTNPITYRTVNCVMPWPNNVYYYQEACSKPSENSGATVGAEVYKIAKQNWPTWLSNSNLSD
ncbi:MAG: ABC transporter substrate-binding protein [Bacilli bacterium]|nr:ABC transporter substrate-binding protein [Bacilli bacterium]